MKKYIHIAKAIKPQLSKEAVDIISEEYTKLRNYDMDQSDTARVSHQEVFQCGHFIISNLRTRLNLLRLVLWKH